MYMRIHIYITNQLVDDYLMCAHLLAQELWCGRVGPHLFVTSPMAGKVCSRHSLHRKQVRKVRQLDGAQSAPYIQ